MNITYRFTVALVLAALALPVSAWAQDAPVVKEKQIKVEVRDGQVYVNGQLTEMNDEGEYWFEDQDGSKTRVFVKDGGENVFVMSRGGNAFFSDDDGEDMVWHSDDGNREIVRMKRRMAPGSADGPRRMRDIIIEREAAPGGMFEFMHEMGDAPMPPGAPQLFSRRMRDRAMAGMGATKEMMDLEREMRDIATKAKEATGDEKKRLLEELDRKLGTAFDLKMTHQREQLAKQESKIAEQRELLKKRQDARADIMRLRRAELLGERDGLDW